MGPVPSFSPTKKKKKVDDDDDDDDDAVVGQVAPPNLQEAENGFITPNEAVQTRGTILITLRNVPPYTLWYVY